MSRRSNQREHRAALYIAIFALSSTIAGSTRATLSAQYPAQRRPKSRKSKLELADAQRASVRSRAESLAENEQLQAAAIEYENAAKLTADPVLFIEAGESYLVAALDARDPKMATAAHQDGSIALDLLHFASDPAASRRHRRVASDALPELITRAEALVKNAKELHAEIEAEQTPQAPVDTAERDPEPQPGRVAVISGAVLTSLGAVALGVGGAGLALGARHQRRAEQQSTNGSNYDAVDRKGKRANTLAFVGLPVGAVLAGAGIALLIIGAKKRKADSTSSYSLVPMRNRWFSGVEVRGRF